MYSDRITDIGSLLGITDTAFPQPALDTPTGDDRERLQAETIIAGLTLRYAVEFFPALCRSARSLLAHKLESARAARIYADIQGRMSEYGITLPVLDDLAHEVADLPGLAESLVAAGLIDPHDSILLEVANLKK